ncbi:DUF309 domain-containing protein [Kurthia massiliensis]|uniref:DUF309 domain-containing protein n=1 Tax=Kurthia massiliensis TaxID=1033739 RepID=UPI0002897477|nr:DUF309 domain-containing protein [Kurthia massiliensis]
MYKRSFVLFLSYFNRNRDYFECHEVLEEHWKDVAPRTRHHELVGFIQLATGMYHWRRGNFRGARTIFKKAELHLRMHSSSAYYEGLDMQQLFEALHKSRIAVECEQPFTPFIIPIIDETLAADVQAVTLPADSEHYLMHKHMLRNRSDVILERQQSLLQKQKLRKQ